VSDPVKIDKAALALAAKLLDRAADEFSNHGCNDFRLVEFMPDAKDRRSLMLAYHTWNGDPSEYDARYKYETVEDFVLMRFLSEVFAKAAK
jgi:hypothetical protein